MIDIQFIRDNPKLVKEKSKQKGFEVDIDKLLKLDKKRLTTRQELDGLRQKRNEHAEKLKQGKPSADQIAEGKKLKDQAAKKEDELKPVETEFAEILTDVPNIFSDDTPLGDEKNNKVIEKFGKAEKSDHQDHLSWLEDRDLVDFERGAKVAGSKFHYSKGALAELEMALANFALDTAKKHNFIPMIVPNMVNPSAIRGTGFAGRGEEKQIYEIKDESLSLIATAEIPLTAYHSGEVLEIEKLPLLYAGWSPCYRVEAGTYGKHSKGLFRTHQFYKVELYVFCQPSESDKWHQKLLEIEQEICEKLKIPYRVVQLAAEELGAPAYKKFDIEFWSPVDGQYRELTSCSNVADYQSRRLNIKFKNKTGGSDYVHTLNATAVVMSRFPIAIIENFQTKKGNVKIPRALQKYMGGKKSI